MYDPYDFGTALKFGIKDVGSNINENQSARFVMMKS